MRMPIQWSLRRVVSVAASCALATTFAACAAPQVPEVFGISRVEQRALEDCREPVQAKLCAAREAGDACWDEVVTRYAGLRDVVARKRFLIDSGCPSPRVEAWLPDVR